MALFGRRDKDAGNEASPLETAQDSAAAPTPKEAPTELPRTEGPWDEADEYPEVPRVDLGALLIPQSADFRIQVQADQTSGAISQVSLVTDNSAVQLQPYAAPRSGGMWDDVRGQISGQINKSGGLVEEKSGPFGVELRAQVQGQDGTLQPARFCGVDGPRWFVRMVFLGQAARDSAVAAPLEEAVRHLVIVRGDQAMPMGNALPMRVPVEATAAGSPAVPAGPAAPERPTISLPERGPEITETR